MPLDRTTQPDLPAVPFGGPRPVAPPVGRGEPAPRDALVPAESLRVEGGAAIVYRLYDIGYEIRLDQALDLLAASAPARVRPVRGEAQALQIKNPPITVLLGPEQVQVDGASYAAEMSARIYDFGVVSLRLRLEAPALVSWPAFTAFGAAVDASAMTGLSSAFAQHLRLLAERIAPAVERPVISAQTEDYVVYRVSRLVDADGAPVSPEALRDADVVRLLLGETRPLSAAARRELLPHRFSYYADDLAILTWDNALVLEPQSHDADVQFILEFANAQLLELRYYDALLDAELPSMYDRVAALRTSGARSLLRRRHAALLAALQTLVADSTELVERAENALKVTDDVYLARVYSAALELFRARAWRSGIDRKLGIIQQTYEMLNAEAQAARAEALEIVIVVLILLEVVMAIVMRH